jgi:hypothetical protein
MFIITIIGTDNSIPITHHKVPQNIRENSITKGLKFNLFPIKRGSTIFPIMASVVVKIMKIIKVVDMDSNCIIENITGQDIAIIDQIFGM